MKRSAKAKCVLMGITLVFSVPSLGTTPTVPATSPIVLAPAENATSAPQSPDEAIALKYLGKVAAPTSAQLMLVTDEHSFGEEMSCRRAWVISFRSLELVLNDREVTVDMDLVLDPDTRRLLAAFTPAKSQWVEPMLPTRDPEAEGEKDGWTVSPLAAHDVTSKVSDVLAKVLASQGIDLCEAGQIIIRPRWVSNKWPAVEKEGQMVPLRNPGPVWIVEILGTRTENHGSRAEDEFYWTGQLILVDDETLEIYRGLYMP